MATLKYLTHTTIACGDYVVTEISVMDAPESRTTPLPGETTENLALEVGMRLKPATQMSVDDLLFAFQAQNRLVVQPYDSTGCFYLTARLTDVAVETEGVRVTTQNATFMAHIEAPAALKSWWRRLFSL